MKFALYDKDGKLISNGSVTPTGAVTQGPQGSSSMSTYSIPVLFGHYWNTNNAANEFNPISILLLDQNNYSLGAADSQWQANNSGSISALSMYEAGPADGDHVVQVYVNGALALTQDMGTGGNGTYFNKAVSIPFKLGDIVTAKTSNTVAGNSQVQLSLTLTYGA